LILILLIFIQHIRANPIYTCAPTHEPGIRNAPNRIPKPPLTSQLIAAFSAIGAFAYLLTSARPLRPVAAREYPYGGLEKELGGHNAARAESEEVDE
jgi:hypothetical protein